MKAKDPPGKTTAHGAGRAKDRQDRQAAARRPNNNVNDRRENLAHHDADLPQFKDQVRDVPARERRRVTAINSSSNEPGRTEEPHAVTVAVVENAVASQVQEAGFPPAPFAERFMDVSFLDELKALQEEIKKLGSIKKCVDKYHSRSLTVGISLLRSAQKQFVDASGIQDPREAKEAWAEKWANEMNKPRTKDTEWAWILDECHRTSLVLLYKMCDFGMGKETEVAEKDNTSTEQQEAAIDKLRHDRNLRVVDVIVGLCLVMDRANCLYHIGHDASNVTGLVWYSQNDEDSLPDYLHNPMGRMMNKKLSWLYDEVLPDVSKKMLAPWMEVALPLRLRPKEP